MKTMQLSSLCALLAIAPASAAGQQFDLVCKGTLEVMSFRGTTTEPFESRYRIDLDQSKYCEKDCRALFALASVQPGSITFIDKRVDTPSEDSILITQVDRETGTYRGTSTSRTPGRPELTFTMKWAGTCEAQPFSGFPQLQTKF